MVETLKNIFVIKATSNVTGNVHYVTIDNEGCVGLVDTKWDASLFNSKSQAEAAIKEHCAGEETHTYTVI